MTVTPLPVVFLRAPLLPVAALRDPAAALRRHPLGAAAIRLASPDLAAALAGRGGAAAQAALQRYARRAAFRATPAGLLAGVGLARLGPRTRIATGQPVAHIEPSWAILAAIGRELLEDAAIRPHVRLRAAPSLLRGPEEAMWLAMDDQGLSQRSAELDPVLTAVLDAAPEPAQWPRVRAALARAASVSGSEVDVDDDDLDAHLLLLIDQGLLVHDLSPPLVGDPPRHWLRRRLDNLPPDVQSRLKRARLIVQDISPAAVTADPTTPHAAVLAHTTRGTATLDARAVARAAALAPLLHGLQQAMSAPVAERALDPELLSRLSALAEWQGAGAYDVAALATGGYGLRPPEDDAPIPAAPPAALLAWLVEQLVASAGARELELDAPALAAVVPPFPAPPTMELLLGLVKQPPGRPPGTGWLLGLHAPAGASFGRFVPALGRQAEVALAQLVAAEAEARPGEETLDVAFAAAPALADLSLHPPSRRRTLALLGWAEASALTPAELRLVIDPAAAEPLGLQTTGGEAVSPSPLHRVRSTTAPPGLYRLLAGWSFARQHRPWVFGWGPLAGLPFLPRVVLQGFVLAPASWRLPEAAELRRPAALARWRRAHDVPRWIQLGEGDELQLIDLDARGAGEQLGRAAPGRAHEVWPPLDRLVDDGGRRLEAVVALVAKATEAEGEAEFRRAAIASTAGAGRVPPPAEQPVSEWSSYLIYGMEEGQDAVLHEAVGPAVAQARQQDEISGWFFLRYVQPADGRPHLRLRVRRASPRFGRRLSQLLQPQRQAGMVVAVETAPYFPETARYGGPALLPVVERLFEASSDLTLALLAAESEGLLPPELDRREHAVRAADALARGLGLNPGERRALAERRRLAFLRLQPEDPSWQKLFRAVGRPLQAALAGQLDGFSEPLAHFVATVRAATAGSIAWSGLLPALLHMQAVRLLGTRSEDEQASYVFWARALQGLAARGLVTPE